MAEALPNQEQRTALFRAMREIGEYQRAQQAGAANSMQIKPDGSKVSVVDTTSETMLMQVLRKFEPHVPVISEERKLSKNMHALKHQGPIWMIDPLDGTSSYLKGYDEYAINVALLSAPDENGKRESTFGAVYFPSKRELYFTNKHGTSTMAKLDESGKVVDSQALRFQTLKDTPEIKVAVGFNDDGSHHFQTSGYIVKTAKHTAGFRIAEAVRGKAHAASFDKPAKMWDVAPWAAIVKGAGGVMACLNDDGTIASAAPTFSAGDRHGEDKFLVPPYLCANRHVLRAIGKAVPVEQERYRA